MTAPLSTSEAADLGAAVLTTLEPRIFDKLFGDKSYDYDLREGTVNSVSDTRIVYLSSDLIRGIYDALYQETGDAWGYVLKSCGYVWGKRVARALRNEMRGIANRDFDQLPVPDFVAVMERYFAHHGWGRLRVFLDDAERHGIVRASLANSLFAEALENVGGPVDHLMSGMLRSVFEIISSRQLDCLQIGDPSAAESKTADFLISTPYRIKILEPAVEQGVDLPEAMTLLRGARSVQEPSG